MSEQAAHSEQSPEIKKPHPKTTEPLGRVALNVNAEAQPTEEQEAVNPNELREKMDDALQRGDMKTNLEGLFDSGVDVNQGDFEGRTALMMSSAKGRKDIVEMLLARGADVNRVFMYQDRIPFSALDAARQGGGSEVVDMLVAHGAKSGRELAAEQAPRS